MCFSYFFLIFVSTNVNNIIMRGYKALLAFFFLSFFSLFSMAQVRNSQYLEYIDRYKDFAIEQMKFYHIPASITLAQALFESRAGTSTLTLRSNNHFGIKCSGRWNGPYACADDDAPNEHFRAYKSAHDSYIDHSKFLSENKRYASLFNYDERDYRSWAKGLKDAGYATNPSYATRLISLIENYELYQYDSKKEEKERHHDVEKYRIFVHQVYLANGLAYVVARDGDDLDLLNAEFGISARRLRKYNDLHKDYTLEKGDIIYLHKKNKSSDIYTYHIVRDGDSLFSISQIYGIQLKYLYKMNHLDSDYIPSVGDTLKLR